MRAREKFHTKSEKDNDLSFDPQNKYQSSRFRRYADKLKLSFQSVGKYCFKALDINKQFYDTFKLKSKLDPKGQINIKKNSSHENYTKIFVLQKQRVEFVVDF